MAPPPKTLLAEPSRFGTSDEEGWVIARRPPPEVAAVYLQHRVAMAVRQHVGFARGSHAALALQLGMKPETLRKKLNGELRLNVVDLMAFMLEIGVDIVPPFDDRESLLPPSDRVVG